MGSRKSSTQTVNTTAPKSEELKALESQFYGISNQIMDGYTKPLGGAGSGHITAPYSGGGPSSSSVGKGGKVGNVVNFLPNGTGSAPQPYDNSTMMGQLLNDAARKTYTANNRYNSLADSADWYTQQSNKALGQSYDAVNQSKTAGDKYFSMADTAYGDAQRYMDEGAGYLRLAPRAGDEWYGKARDIWGKAEGMIDEDRGYIRKADTTNKWYDDYTREMLGGAKNMLTTGDIPAPILEAMRGNVKTGLDQSMGANLNDWAARGVINSSVANKGLSDMSNAVGDTLQRHYLDSFNSILGGYNQTAGTAAQAGKTFTDSLLDIARTGNANTQNAIGLGDSYAKTGNMRVNDMLNTAKGFGEYSGLATQRGGSLMNAGSQRIADWLGISQGYGNVAKGYQGGLAQNIAEREHLSKATPEYYKTAFAPVAPAYDFMQKMQMDRWNGDKQDTIVQQGGK